MANNDKKDSPATPAKGSKGSVPAAGGKSTDGKTQDSAAEQVIALFGGLRPMAGKLGIAVSTIQGWKARHHIPENRHNDILEAAKSHDIALDPALLSASGSQSASDNEKADGTAVTEETPTNDSLSPDTATGPYSEASTSKDNDDKEQGAKKSVPTNVSSAPVRSGGIGGSLLTGVLSSAVIIGGLGAAAYVTKDRWQARLIEELGLVSAQEAQDLSGRLSQLEDQASKAGDNDLASAVADLKKQLTQLEAAEKAQEERIAQLSQTSQGTSQGTSPETTQDVTRSSLSSAAPAPSPQSGSSTDSTTASHPGPSTQSASVLAGQLQALETRVDQKLAALPQNNEAEAAAERARIKGLQAKIDLLDEELTTVQKLLNRNESQLDSTADQLAGLRDTAGAVADLRDRLNASEKRLKTVENTALAASSQRAADAALALAVGQLREALRYSGGYSHELTGLQNLAKGNADLEAPLRTLEASAEQGLPSLRQLKDDFAPVAQAIAATEVSSAAGTDWSQTVLKNLQDIVVVRPVGNVTGDSATAIAARAEVRLGDGDLAGAVSELSTLPEAARAPASAWLKEAQQRLDAEAALDQLTRLSINRLAPNQPPASSSGSTAAPSSATEG